MRRAAFLLLAVLSASSLGCQSEVVRGVDQATAARAIVELEKNEIEASSKHVAGEWTVFVSRSQRVNALQLLDQLRFVPAGGPSGELKVGILSDSYDRERARLQQQAEQLARSIERIPGVYEARVHLSKADLSEASASVLVLHSGSSSLETRGIRVLVAGATGISPANIRVVGIRPHVTNMPKLTTDALSKADSSGIRRSIVENRRLIAIRVAAAVLGLSAGFILILIVRWRRSDD